MTELKLGTRSAQGTGLPLAVPCIVKLHAGSVASGGSGSRMMMMGTSSTNRRLDPRKALRPEAAHAWLLNEDMDCAAILGTVIDISCSGVRLRIECTTCTQHDGPQETEHGRIFVGQEWLVILNNADDVAEEKREPLVEQRPALLKCVWTSREMRQEESGASVSSLEIGCIFVQRHRGFTVLPNPELAKNTGKRFSGALMAGDMLEELIERILGEL